MRQLLIAFAFLAASATSAQAQPAEGSTVLRLAVQADARLTPDVAVVQAGVVSEAATAAQATAANARAMTEALRALRRSGVAERDLQTKTVTLQPQYAYAEGAPPRLTGYRSENVVQVTVRELKNLGKIIDAVTAAGANEIQGIEFSAENSDEALAQARRDAIADARQRAQLYADALGMRIVRVTLIQEEAAAGPPIPVAYLARAEASTPVVPGELVRPVSLTAEFELR